MLLLIYPSSRRSPPWKSLPAGLLLIGSQWHHKRHASEPPSIKVQKKKPDISGICKRIGALWLIKHLYNPNPRVSTCKNKRHSKKSYPVYERNFLKCHYSCHLMLSHHGTVCKASHAWQRSEMLSKTRAWTSCISFCRCSNLPTPPSRLISGLPSKLQGILALLPANQGPVNSGAYGFYFASLDYLCACQYISEVTLTTNTKSACIQHVT